MTTVASFFPGRARAGPDFRGALLAYARTLLDVPYEINLPNYPRQPGRGLGKKYPHLDGGLDCSGYVLNVLQHMGLLTSLDPDLTNCDRIWTHCQVIDRASARPADLVFFRGTYGTSGMSHIGFVTQAGGGAMISACEPKVTEECLDRYWEQHLAGFGRLRDFPERIDAPPDDEPIRTRFGDAPRDLSAAIRRLFPREQWLNAAEVAHCESGWNRTCLADTTWLGPCGTPYTLSNGKPALTEVARGYFQINGCAHPQWNSEEMFDCERNVEAAWRLYQLHGWRPWLYSAQLLKLL